MSKRSLTDEKIQSITQLRDRLLYTLQFIQRVEDFPVGKIFEEEVERIARMGDLRLLSLLGREIERMTDAMASFNREGLEAQIFARFGVNGEDKRQKIRGQAARALARGHIGSEVERARIEDYVADLQADGENLEEIEQLSKLLRST